MSPTQALSGSGSHELTIEYVGCDWQVVIAVRCDLESPLAFCPDAVQLDELLNALLAHWDAPAKQCLACAWPAIGRSCIGMDDLDVNQQCIVTEVAPLRTAGGAHKVLVITADADLQNPALH